MPKQPEAEARADTQIVVADMLFGLAVILLIIVTIASQAMAQIARTLAAKEVPTEAELISVIEDYATASGETVLFAAQENLQIIGPERIETIAQTELSNWAPRFDGPPLLIVAPEGLETDFLLGVPLSRANLQDVIRLRIATQCPALVRDTSGALACSRNG